MKTPNQWVNILAVQVLIIILGAVVHPSQAGAVLQENQAEKEANLKQQALGGLFHRWTFDQQNPEESLAEFSQVGLGEGSAFVWSIGVDMEAPTPPGVLKVAPCQTEFCYRMLVAKNLQYEYPDVSVR